MTSHPSKPSPVAGAKFHALATKINEGSRLGICSLLLVTGFVITIPVMSQGISQEKTSEIRADFRTTLVNLGPIAKRILLKPTADGMTEDGQAAWNFVKEFATEKTDTYLRCSGLIHAVHAEGENPHAVMIFLEEDSPLPTMTIVPKEICTEEYWKILTKAKVNPEFGTKWGYNIPDTPGVGTTPFNSNWIVSRPKLYGELPPITIPVKRTVTDTQGRSLEGTIISKTDTTISFKKKGETKPFDIKIDLLSNEDQEFIQAISNEPKLAPTVVLLRQSNDKYETFFKSIAEWLVNNGYNVTLGVRMGNDLKTLREENNIPNTIKIVIIQKWTDLDRFDFVWMPVFGEGYHSGSATNHLLQSGTPTIICINYTRGNIHSVTTKEGYKDPKHYKKYSKQGKYINQEKNFIFYEDTENRWGEPDSKLLKYLKKNYP